MRLYATPIFNQDVESTIPLSSIGDVMNCGFFHFLSCDKVCRSAHFVTLQKMKKSHSSLHTHHVTWITNEPYIAMQSLRHYSFCCRLIVFDLIRSVSQNVTLRRAKNLKILQFIVFIINNECHELLMSQIEQS